VTAEQLAAALAARLASVVPPELTISVAGPVIVVRSVLGTSEHDVAWAFEEHGAAYAVEALLDQLQSDAAEVTGEPWPATAPDPMPDSFARAESGAIVAGYEAGLTLDPIPVL
jgi:hypothetical protein